MKHTKQIFTALILIASNVSIFTIDDKLLLNLVVSSLICILFLIYSSSNSGGGKDHTELQKIAHDLRSPLAVIKMIATTPKFNKKEKELVNIAFERIDKMISSLLKTREDSSSLSNTIENVLKEKRIISNRTIAFNNHLDKDSSCISPIQLSRTLSNLIDNAIEACSNRELIEVSAKTGLFYSIIKIKDHGKGMTKEVLKNALEGGFTTKRRGNGIGLSSSRRQIELLGGTFDVRSIFGTGTTVTIRVPRPEAQTPQILSPNIFAALSS